MELKTPRESHKFYRGLSCGFVHSVFHFVVVCFPFSCSFSGVGEAKKKKADNDRSDQKKKRRQRHTSDDENGNKNDGPEIDNAQRATYNTQATENTHTDTRTHSTLECLIPSPYSLLREYARTQTCVWSRLRENLN